MSIVIPAALQVCLDDVGWWCGRDDRAIGGPSRSGFIRNHCAADYEAIHQFGQAIGQVIYCAFILGEWDTEGRLSREIPHFAPLNHRPDPVEMQKAVEIINASPYIEVAVHGLCHGYYAPDNPAKDTSDYYIRYAKDRMEMIPEPEVRLRLDAFFSLCREHGITKPIRGFVPPSGAYRGFELSSILKEYGLLYNVSSFHRPLRFTNVPDPALLDEVFVEDGFITLKDQIDPIPWDAHDADMRSLPPCYGVIGMHWPNILHADPNRHGETLQKLVPYFERCADTFGIVLSKDVAFAATQALYRKYAVLREDTLDLSAVPPALGRQESFILSSAEPLQFRGAAVLSTEVKSGFINYELSPGGKAVNYMQI